MKYIYIRNVQLRVQHHCAIISYSSSGICFICHFLRTDVCLSPNGFYVSGGSFVFFRNAFSAKWGLTKTTCSSSSSSFIVAAGVVFFFFLLPSVVQQMVGRLSVALFIQYRCVRILCDPAFSVVVRLHCILCTQKLLGMSCPHCSTLGGGGRTCSCSFYYAVYWVVLCYTSYRGTSTRLIARPLVCVCVRARLHVCWLEVNLNVCP